MPNARSSGHGSQPDRQGYTFLAVSVIGHTVLIAAAAITVATWTAATAKPDIFVRSSTQQEPESSKDQPNKQ